MRASRRITADIRMSGLWRNAPADHGQVIRHSSLCCRGDRRSAGQPRSRTIAVCGLDMAGSSAVRYAQAGKEMTVVRSGRKTSPKAARAARTNRSGHSVRPTRLHAHAQAAPGASASEMWHRVTSACTQAARPAIRIVVAREIERGGGHVHNRPPDESVGKRRQARSNKLACFLGTSL
ncbi:hypothetical protein BV20DRAFT_635869 [Pilatotrama ljubarskyi]|nr:hypothetical protein BV20DRAFT_635869 [Pilatotrama ljubarskyi]